MNAARQFVAELDRIGARLVRDGERLKIVPPAGQALSPDLIERGRALKPDLLALLREGEEQDQQEALAERSAIAEIDGGLARTEADFLATASVVPLMSGERSEDRERVVLHFAEHFDRLRRRRGPIRHNEPGDAA